ncbi:winged helix-turn-helix transcriptional regulator [Chachezhania antarctica]|uniref:winged helix-turn-helix transcriptional regulator n=1 Tax=Chachezhania antarctica TaxID=2340860 RepID=UPI000EAE1AFF|nr:helix-turn-helix domain-containing protein [Chachezhania antarctica]|tara:strand:+ start:1304 stop:1780 length:477 start_codon:yes stop_codon:yes gene_type:complete
MSRNDLASSACAVARSIEKVGDTWSLMLMREFFLGTRRFEALHRNTRISPHVLSGRLKAMCAEGIIEKRQYSEHPPRDEYLLTEKGRDLWPVVMALMTWGEKWLDGPEAVALRHKACLQEMRPTLVCPECGEPVTARDVAAHVTEEFAGERCTGSDKG